MVLDQKVPERDGRLLLLDEADNVVVATSRIRAGESIVIEGAAIVLASELPIGHKLARRAIVASEKIVKYGVPIGSATAEIAAGAHVHVHNLKSDYTPTYYLEDAQSNLGSAT